jgi:rod shape determining protein RodA
MATRAESARIRQPASAEVAAFVRHVDYLLLAAVGGVIAYGLWVLAAVTRSDVPGDPDYYVFRQQIYVAVGAVALAATTAVNPELYRRYARVLYALAIFVLVLVLAVGEDVRGSKRWIPLGSFNFQPSELGKLLLVLCIAAFVADRARRLEEWRTTFAAIGLSLPPIFLVFEEPDFGTALVYAGAVAAILYFAGVRWLHLGVLAGAAVLLAVTVLWFLPSAGMQVLDDYQMDRLTGFVNPDVDPGGKTYNVTQSITAVGSGGLDGRGVAGASQTNLNYLPEHNTDFIFSSLAEQRGFLGAAVLLLLYGVLVWRAIKIVAVAPSLFQASVAGAITAVFLFQVFVNIGMTIGIAPITGITLPFVSFGGSSLITLMIMVGLLEAIHIRGRLAAER